MMPSLTQLTLGICESDATIGTQVSQYLGEHSLLKRVRIVTRRPSPIFDDGDLSDPAAMRALIAVQDQREAFLREVDLAIMAVDADVELLTYAVSFLRRVQEVTSKTICVLSASCVNVRMMLEAAARKDDSLPTLSRDIERGAVVLADTIDAALLDRLVGRYVSLG